MNTDAQKNAPQCCREAFFGSNLIAVLDRLQPIQAKPISD